MLVKKVHTHTRTHAHTHTHVYIPIHVSVNTCFKSLGLLCTSNTEGGAPYSSLTGVETDQKARGSQLAFDYCSAARPGSSHQSSNITDTDKKGQDLETIKAQIAKKRKIDRAYRERCKVNTITYLFTLLFSFSLISFLFLVQGSWHPRAYELNLYGDFLE